MGHPFTGVSFPTFPHSGEQNSIPKICDVSSVGLSPREVPMFYVRYKELCFLVGRKERLKPKRNRWEVRKHVTKLTRYLMGMTLDGALN